jgi:CheY-like chemotaxis protein
MLTRPHLPMKIVIAIVLGIVASVRLAFPSAVSHRMDATFFLVLAAAVLVVLLPWERLTGLKAAGLEVTLELPQVAGALQGLGLDRLQDERLRGELARLEREIAEVSGSRVLWIDDEPRRLVALRRLLRAFGVETVMAVSSSRADAILAEDVDFDLIASDVQRPRPEDQITLAWIRESEQKVKSDRPDQLTTTDGRCFYKLHEGVNYVVRLRTDDGGDPFVRSLPVLFYAAYDWTRLARFTAVAVATSPETEISNSPDTFVPRAIRMLARARSQEIILTTEKERT